MVYLIALLDEGIDSWKDLATELGVPPRIIMDISCEQPMKSPAKHLLEYAAYLKPNCTLNHLKSALQEINRGDLVATIDNYFGTSKGNYSGLCKLDMTG